MGTIVPEKGTRNEVAVQFDDSDKITMMSFFEWSISVRAGKIVCGKSKETENAVQV
jgi:hypothetical protein